MFGILFCVVDTWVYTIVEIQWTFKICIILLYVNYKAIKNKSYIDIKISKSFHPSRTASAPILLSIWVFYFPCIFAPGIPLTFLHSQQYVFQRIFIVFSPDFLSIL